MALATLVRRDLWRSKILQP